jgi:signal transduction histidine kinase
LSAEFIASSVVPLLVALFNLLVAGYALAAGLKERSKLGFAAGPAGVGLWALAWFISVFEVQPAVSAQVLGTIGGVLAMSGFAIDSLAGLDARTARRITWSAVFVTMIAIGSLWLELHARIHLSVYSYGARIVAVALSAVVMVAQGIQLRAGAAEQKDLARWMLISAAFTTAVCLAIAIAAVIGDRTIVDPLLLVILLSELFALVYIAKRRVEVRVLLSRAVTYALLSMLVAAVAALAFAQIGYPVEPVIVAVTVAISLMASALFMGLSDRLSASVERVLFPTQARLERALLASKGELMALRRRLERAEKLAIAGELAASVAHEIKNPLAPIRGYAQLLEGKLSEVSDRERRAFEKGLSIIREETDRIDRRIADLLRMVRVDREKASSEESFDVNRVAIEAALVAEGEAGTIRIVHKLDGDLGRVVGNEDEMRGALLNLLKNAVEAMSASGGGSVELVTRKENGRAVIEVIDEGPGLQPRDQERAFDAFYTTKKGGTGLGLAIARSAVEAAGGSISLRPRDDRQGTIARIDLDPEGANHEHVRAG